MVRMAEQYIALLRGINVGRAKRVTMADLRDAVSSLGCRNVKTLLNSGNVVFTAEKAPTEKALQNAVADVTGVSSDVVLLSGKRLVQVVDENPLADVATDPSRLMVMFFTDARDRTQLRKLVDDSWAPEQLALGRQAAYIWCPEGIASSALMEAVGEQQFRGTVTTRNWRTVTKLRALLD
jgi:uncharacterized protein (DUF1697 family)